MRRRGNWLIVAAGALGLACLACSGLSALAYVQLPQQDWKEVQACAGLAVGRQRAGLWWTSPRYSPAPAIAYSTVYSICGTVPWPPFLVSQGNSTFPLPGARRP